ncbi:hypothetical protein [Cyanobium sp. NIES-981]|uniref:hypothetical protein n=1 Tax=Cyanobium sp. NIES-981 TaxID=1851505 RepID=UPI0007DD259F|nr:hypothetical protein [Cyanobium sp. NIES-981]SBO44647.1 conserved protein of unknown function [Cyanobium sp. NIES-981]
MTRISKRRDRHFMDESGRLFWINGPEHHCYLSEQRQWRSGLSFEDVLDWKQCAPSGLVSQRFPSLRAACEAFEHNQVAWSRDLYLLRMGERMEARRSDPDYKPTAMAVAESQGARPRVQPWRLPDPLGPCCGLPPRSQVLEMPHPHRRRRSAAASPRQLAELQPALLGVGDPLAQL